MIFNSSNAQIDQILHSKLESSRLPWKGAIVDKVRKMINLQAKNQRAPQFRCREDTRIVAPTPKESNPTASQPVDPSSSAQNDSLIENAVAISARVPLVPNVPEPNVHQSQGEAVTDAAGEEIDIVDEIYDENAIEDDVIDDMADDMVDDMVDDVETVDDAGDGLVEDDVLYDMSQVRATLMPMYARLACSKQLTFAPAHFHNCQRDQDAYSSESMVEELLSDYEQEPILAAAPRKQGVPNSLPERPLSRISSGAENDYGNDSFDDEDGSPEPEEVDEHSNRRQLPATTASRVAPDGAPTADAGEPTNVALLASDKENRHPAGAKISSARGSGGRGGRRRRGGKRPRRRRRAIRKSPGLCRGVTVCNLRVDIQDVYIDGGRTILIHSRGVCGRSRQPARARRA